MNHPIERPRYSPPPAAANVVPAETAGSDPITPSTPNDGDWAQFVGGNASGSSVLAAYPGLGTVKALSPASAKAAYQECAAMEGNLSDLLASMAATMALMFQKLRKNAVESQAMDLKTQVQAMQGQAAKMRDAAENNYTHAKTQAWSQFASGCVGIAGGAYSAYSAVKAGNAPKAEPTASASPDKTAAKTPAADPAADAPTVEAPKAQAPAKNQEVKDMDELLATKPRGRANTVPKKDEGVDMDELMASEPRKRSSNVSPDERPVNNDVRASPPQRSKSFNVKRSEPLTEKDEAKSINQPADTDAVPSTDAASKPAMVLPKTSADVWNLRGQVSKTFADSFGTVITSVGTSMASSYKHDADLDEAQSKELEAQSTKAAAARSMNEEIAQMSKEAIQRLFDHYKALVDQEQATSKAIIQNI